MPPEHESSGLELVTLDTGNSNALGAVPSDGVHIGRSKWYNTASLLVGEVIGTGILAVPWAVSRLGWAFGMISVLGFSFAGIYSGVLLSRVKNEFHGKAVSYAEMAETVSGPRFGGFTRVMVIINWALGLPYYLLAATDAFRIIFPGASLCTSQWTIIVCAILIGPCQLQTLHAISYLTAPSTGAIVLAIIMTVVGLGQEEDGAFGEGTTGGLQPGLKFLGVFNSLTAVIFAYGGQSIFLEIMSEMKDTTEFPKACTASYVFMLVALAPADSNPQSPGPAGGACRSGVCISLQVRAHGARGLWHRWE
jgi:vesicular inhibitory amino acid transporter